MVIERTFTINNAVKFCPYLLTHQCNKKLGDSIVRLIGNIYECDKRDTSLIQMHMTYEQFNALNDYLGSINKGEMQMVERSVKGNWQLFLDELLDDCDIPF